MPNPAYVQIPKTLQFQIGKTFDASSATPTVPTPIIGIVKRDLLPIPRTVFGLVENYGEGDLSLEIDESSNNNTANLPGLPASADPYSDRAIRVDAAAVSTGIITVKPGGKVVFVIESTAASDKYWRFQTGSTTPDAFGRLTLAYFDGTIDIRQIHTTGP